MKILVTGGNGYVGRELCRLLYCDHQVTIVDNLRYGQNRFQAAERSNYKFFSIDLRNLDELKSVIDEVKPEVIIHLAAIHFIPECDNDPTAAFTTNVMGTFNIASLCPSTCRLVFASSGAVYAPDEHPHHEQTSVVKPTDIYGLTKLQGEEYIHHFATKHNFPAVIVRLFNVVGPGETNPHVLPEIFAQLKAGHRQLRLGNIEAQRDYIHVRDAAAGFKAVAVNSTVQPGEVITVNLGTQQTYSVRDLMYRLQKVNHVDFDVLVDPQRLRKSDRPFLAANNTAIKQLFHWTPKLSIDSTLSDMWIEPDLPDYLTQKYKL